jgi:hypothetical protein
MKSLVHTQSNSDTIARLKCTVVCKYADSKNLRTYVVQINIQAYLGYVQ